MISVDEADTLRDQFRWIRSINWYDIAEDSPEFDELQRIYSFVPNASGAELSQMAGVEIPLLHAVRMYAPNPTVDFIIGCDFEDGKGVRYGLVTRYDEPWMGKLFFPGGKKVASESDEAAFRRVMRRELGHEFSEAVSMGRFHFCGSYNLLNPRGKDCPLPYFTQPHIYAGMITRQEEMRIRLDSTSYGITWVEGVLPHYQWQLAKGMRLAGVADVAL